MDWEIKRLQKHWLKGDLWGRDNLMSIAQAQVYESFLDPCIFSKYMLDEKEKEEEDRYSFHGNWR